MGARERFIRDNALVDAITDDIAARRARIAAEEAAVMRRLAEAWELAERQAARTGTADTARREMPLRCIAAQIGAAVRMNDRIVQSQMHRAWELVSMFPATVGALEAGRIGRAYADAILDAGRAIDDADVRAAFESVVEEWAERHTVASTRAYARRLAEKLVPRTMAERHADAVEDRFVRVTDLEDGMSEIIARVPTVLARGILDRLTRQAAALREAESDRADEEGFHDERTADQMRADLLSDLLLTAAPAVDPTPGYPGGLGAIRAHVQLTMPVTTLTGVTAGGAELDGLAPVDPESARRLAGDAPVWERVLLDPVRAVPVAVDRYRPTPAQRRFLQARDQHCRMPGCRRPARMCQIDHNDEWQDGGTTRLDNLACLCVRHHTLKNETGWTVRQLPGGRLEFTSPTGRATLDDPPPRVLFAPDGDPPPF